jgi:uncharacterized protein YggE
MKYILASSVSLFIIVMSGIWLHDQLSYSWDNDTQTTEVMQISFRVTGSASRPVDYITLDVAVVKDGIDQSAVKAECDSASEEMLKTLNNYEHTKIEPRDIEVRKDVNLESGSSRILVNRSYDVRIDDVSKIEEIIGKISRISGCMIRSTEYHSSKLPEIRKLAVIDGKTKMDEYCNELLVMHGGKRVDIESIRIDDESNWTGGGAMLMSPSTTASEAIQNVQMMKNVEVKIEYDVDVHILK